MQREREQQRIDDSMVLEKQDEVVVHSVTGQINPAQRALRFNLNVKERTAFLAAKPKTTLFQHQIEGVAFMKLREQPGNAIGGSAGGILLLPPRTGKTKTFLMRVHQDIQDRLARGEPRFGLPTLLIVPKNVADTMNYENKDLFVDGAELFARVVLSDTSMSRDDIHGIVSSHDLIITSYSTLLAFYQRWYNSHSLCEDAGPNLMFKTRWGRVIADEAHRLANNKNVVAKAVRTLSGDHFWYVTATPIQNATTDVLSALKFIHVSEEFLYMRNVPFLLNGLLFKRDYDDLIKINARFAQLKPPARADMRRSVTFGTESERILYAHVHEQSFQHLNHVPTTEGPRAPEVFTAEIRPENMGLRLRQTCVSHWLLPPDFIFPVGMRYSSEEMDGKMWKRWIESKLTGTYDAQVAKGDWPGPSVLPPISTKELAVLDYIRTKVRPNGEKVVVFSEWKGALDRLHKLVRQQMALEQGMEDGVVCVNGTVKGPARREALAAMWNDPQKYIMLVTLQSGGLGEDFTFANHGILIDPWWTPATEFQALMRLFGIKQTRKITIIVLCMDGTIEDHVQARANEKLEYEKVMKVTAAPDEDDDPMIVSADDNGVGLLADPNEEPSYFDGRWMTTYMKQAIQPAHVYHF